MRIQCVGGGPGGLFFAIAAKRADPTHEVTVVERRPPDATYGWGIAVATSADYTDDLLHMVHAVDPRTATAIRGACTEWSGQRVARGNEPPVHLGGSGYSMGRQRLIDILVDRARELGSDVRFETEAEADDPSLTRDADLIVLADGAGSRLRRGRAERFGTTETLGRNRHIWLGTTLPIADFTYAFERTRAGWIWFYGYRYESDASTVIVECSAQTWAELGFDTADDAMVVTELSRIFARHLRGHRLHVRSDGSGRNPWETFSTVRNARWSVGNVVLLGDSAHTAHFSIGSGTKLAMQDAAALGRALAGCSPSGLAAALHGYEAERRPAVHRLQEAAARSAGWFEEVDQHASLSPLQFAFSLRMRRNTADRGAFSGSVLLFGLHRATQWRWGREVRRALATRRRAARRRRMHHIGPAPASAPPMIVRGGEQPT